MSWGGLADKLRAEKAASDKAALDKAEAECQKEHGCSLRQHITNAEISAVVTPEAVAKGRSGAGTQWMNDPAKPTHPVPSINAYHDLEEQAKAAARAGNIPLAIQRLEDANRTQEDYELERFGGANSAHSASKTFRLQRRNSLDQIHRNIIASDKGVTQAKLKVGQILSKHGAKFPGLG